MKFRHVQPDMTYREKAKEFVEEFKTNNSKMHGGGNITMYLENATYEEWLKNLNHKKQIIADKTLVPDETYFLVNEENKIIGIINIRLALNDKLRNIGGHIGYSIRPSERGKCYNKINLYLGLKRLNEVGEKEALIDCEVNNKASSGTIKALGGKLTNRKNTEKYGIVESYIINIEESLKKFKDIYEKYLIYDN